MKIKEETGSQNPLMSSCRHSFVKDSQRASTKTAKKKRMVRSLEVVVKEIVVTL